MEPFAGALHWVWTEGCRHIQDRVDHLEMNQSQVMATLRLVGSPHPSDHRRLCLASVSSIPEITGTGTQSQKNRAGAEPSIFQLLKHPVALIHYVPRDLSLFVAGAFAGALAKTITAPLDRVKILMQVHGVDAAGSAKKSANFLEAIVNIKKEEGIMGYWKGNLPQVIRVIPYSAVQLFAYELYKKIFRGNGAELSVGGRLAAGACAGMTSTLVTYPLDTLRLRMAVDPASKTMVQMIRTMLQEEGVASLYRGLGPSLLGIAPYIAVNFCVFDLIKKSIPDEVRQKPQASFITALLSATLATTMCYPLDTVRRQMQMKGTSFASVWEAIPGIVVRDGLVGLYKGFLPNILKNLPNSSIRLTTFDAAKNLLTAGESAYQKLRQEQISQTNSQPPIM